MNDLEPELYRQAFLNTENPMILTDTDYVIQAVNDACLEFTGYDRDELVGNLPLMLFSDPATYEDAIESLEANEPWEGFFETETKQGNLIYGRGSAIPLFVDGEKRGYGGIFVDLTERRRFEQTLKVIRRVLRHDLRNEMNLVRGAAELMETKTSDEELLDHIELLKTISDRLVRRSEKARELERVLYEGFEQPLQPTELEPVLERQLASVRQYFEDAEFVLQSVSDEPILANDTIDAVVEGILENAVIHNDGDPYVEVSSTEREEWVVLEVADNGPGVADARKDQIFGREETDQLHHGEGFTLYFVDLVVDIYGGRVDVRDNDMGGATFEVVLPRA